MRFAQLVVLAMLAACSINPVTYTGLDGGGGDDAGVSAGAPVTIGGTVHGLAGMGLVLAVGDQTLARDTDGSFTFATPIARGTAYSVTVQTQPIGPTQQCVVSNGSGVTGDADITNVDVACTVAGFTIGGTVEGLSGSGLMLQSSSGEMLAVGPGQSTFTFHTPVDSGGHYAIELVAQPTTPTQSCALRNGSGDVSDANITNLAITCTTLPFKIRGSITGLVGIGLRLRNNGGDEIAASGTGFEFPTSVLSGADYAVTIVQQPSSPTQTCSVSAGSGTVGGADVTSVTINCATSKFTIGGTVTGLAGSGLVLQNNGGDDRAVSTASFAFGTAIASGGTYNVTIKTQPTTPWQTCSVSNGSGTVSNANITNVAVTCTTNKYSIGGTVTGLAPGNAVTLRNNDADPITRLADGGFSFPATIASGQSYAVTVAGVAGPIAQSCTVANASGMVGGASITNVAVTCTTKTFTIGGTVTGLSGTGLVLQDNGGDDLPLGANGTFTFGTKLASGATYNVTIKSSPSGLSCTAASASGTVGAANVTNVSITCTPGWSTSLFPITLPNEGDGAGDIAFDGNGDLLVVQFTLRTVYRVSRTNGAATVVASNIGGTTGSLTSVAYRAATNTIYANTYGAIYTISGSGAVTLLVQPNIGYINGCAFAPPGFGNYGGFLICITQANVTAFNPDTGVFTTFASPGVPTGSNLSDLAFAPDGTLYVSGSSVVKKVGADGSVTTLVSDLASADGITISPDGQRMFIADSGADAAIGITLPGLVKTTISSGVDVNGGYAVGGILAAPGGALIVLTDPGRLVAFPY